jgi:hypothetical protein
MGMAVAAVAIAGWALWPRHTVPTRVTRFSVPLPEKADFGNFLNVSPDGRKLVFNTTGPEGAISVRDLDSLKARLLPATQDGARMLVA